MADFIDIKWRSILEGQDKLLTDVNKLATEVNKIIKGTTKGIEGSDIFKALVAGLNSLKTASESSTRETTKASETLQKEFQKAQAEASKLGTIVKGMGKEYANLFIDTNKYIAGLRVADLVDILEVLKRQFGFLAKSSLFQKQITEASTMRDMITQIYEAIAKYNVRAQEKITIPQMEMALLEAIRESGALHQEILMTERSREAILMKNVALEAEQALMMAKQASELTQIEQIEKGRAALLQNISTTMIQQMDSLSGALSFLGDKTGIALVSEGIEKLRIIYSEIEAIQIDTLSTEQQIAEANTQLIAAKNAVLQVANAIGISYEKELKDETEILRLYQMKQQMIQASITPMQIFLQAVERMGLAMQAITWGGNMPVINQISEMEAILLNIGNRWQEIKEAMSKEVPLALTTQIDVLQLKLEYIATRIRQIGYEGGGMGGGGGDTVPPTGGGGATMAPMPHPDISAWEAFLASMTKIELEANKLYQTLQEIASMKMVKGDMFDEMTARVKALEAEIDRVISGLSKFGLADLSGDKLAMSIIELSEQSKVLQSSYAGLVKEELALNAAFAQGKINGEMYKVALANIQTQQEQMKISAISLQEKLAAVFKQLQVEKQTAQINALQKEFNELEMQLNRLGQTGLDAGARVQILQRQMQILKDQTRLNTGATQEMNKAYLQKAALLKEASKAVNEYEGILRKYGMRMKQLIEWQLQWYLGAGIIWGTFFKLKDAVSEFLAFSQGITDVGAITQATVEELKKMGPVVRDVATSSTMGFKAGTDALKIMGQAGMSAADSMNTLNTVAMLTTATGASTTDVVKLLTTAMNVWNISASDSTRIGNALAAALNYSKLEIGDLAVAFNYVAPQARLMGESLESTLAMVAELSQMGIRASTIGTGLSQFMGSLLAPTKRFSEALGKAGLSMKDLTDETGRLLPFIGIIRKLEEAGMDVATVFEGLEKREARNLATSLVAGSYAFEQMERAIGGTSAMTVMFNKSMEGTQNQLKVLGNQLLDVIFTIVEKFEPAVVMLAKTLRELLITIKDIGPLLVFIGAWQLLPMILSLVETGILAVMYAIEGFNIAATGTPWGLLIVGATALIGAITGLRYAFDDTKKAKEQYDAGLQKASQYQKEAADVQQLIGVMRAHNASMEQKKAAYDKLKEIVPKVTNLYKSDEEAISDLSKETSRATGILDLYTNSLIKNAIAAQLQGSQGILKQYEDMKKKSDELSASLEGEAERYTTLFTAPIVSGSLDAYQKLGAVQSQIEKLKQSDIGQLTSAMASLSKENWEYAKSTGMLNAELIREIEIQRGLKTVMERPIPGGRGDDASKVKDYSRQIISAYMSQNKDMITIQQTYQDESIKELDVFHRLGLIDTEKYYETRRGIVKYYNDIMLSDTAETEKKIFDEAMKRMKGAKSEEQRKAIFEQYKKDVEELAKRTSEITQELNEEEFKTFAASIQDERRIIDEHLQHLLTMTTMTEDQRLAAVLDSYKQEEDAIQFAYDHQYVSATDYYNKLHELNVKELEDRKKTLQAKAEAEIRLLEVRQEVLESQGVVENSDEIIKIENAIKEIRLKYLGDVADAERDYTNKRISLNHKAYDDIRKIWEDQGANGVIGKALEDVHKKWEQVWTDIYDITVKIFEDIQQAGSDILFDAFKGKLKSFSDYFESILDDILRYFTNTVSKMAAQNIMGVFMGGTSANAYAQGLQGPAMANGMFYSQPQGMLSGIGSLLPYGGLGAGLGSLMGGGTGGTIGGGLGGLLGATLLTGAGTAGYGLIGGALTSGLFGAGMSGAMLGSIVPIIGTLIGAAIGALAGKIFGGGDKETRTKLKGEYSPEQGFEWMRKRPGQESYFKQGEQSEVAGYLDTYFNNIRETALQFAKDMNLDLAKFDEVFKFGRKKFKTEKEFLAAVNDWTGTYVEFLTGIDFKKFQKDGEDIVDTIGRIMDAVLAIPDIKDSINEWITAIEGSSDVAATIKGKIADSLNGIEDLWAEYDEFTDPADQIAKLNEIKNAQIQYFYDIKQAVQGLVASIEQAKTDMMQFAFDIDSKIADLTGNTGEAVSVALEKVRYLGTLIQGYLDAGDTENALKWIQQGGAAIDQWLSATIAQIQEQYELETEKNEDAINALEEQLALVRKWSSVLDTVSKTIFDLTTGGANPQDVLERMAIARAEISRVQTLYRSSTGEDKIKYAGDLQDLYKSLLDITNEAGETLADYQRPGTEYQEIYDFVISGLEEIQADAQSFADTEEELQAKLNVLTEKQNNLQNQNNQTTSAMNQAIQVAKNQAAEWYKWIKDHGLPLYQSTIDSLQSALKAIIGEGTVESFLADLKKQTVEELKKISGLLDSILTKMGGGTSGGEGTTGTESSTAEYASESVSKAILDAAAAWAAKGAPGAGTNADYEQLLAAFNQYGGKLPMGWAKPWADAFGISLGGMAEGGAFFPRASKIITDIAEVEPEYVLPERRLVSIVREAMAGGGSAKPAGDIHVEFKQNFDFTKAVGNLSADELMEAAKKKFMRDLDFDTELKKKLRKVVG